MRLCRQAYSALNAADLYKVGTLDPRISELFLACHIFALNNPCTAVEKSHSILQQLPHDSSFAVEALMSHR